MAKGFKTGGRVVGSKNKRVPIVAEILARNNFNVVEELLQMYHLCKGSGEPAQTAIRCLEALLPYVYPKVSMPDVNIDVFMLQRIENLITKPREELINIATTELKRLGKPDEL